MEWLKSKISSDSNLEMPYNWLKLEYFEALNVLFRIENALRVFVYIILKGEIGEGWADLSLINDDGKQTTIGAIAKKRLAQDKNYAYLGYILSSPLVHLTSGELIRIITSESYWPFFKPHFQGAKEIIKTKLDEIGNVRNSLAHFRPIRREDIELVKSNSIHILSSIEKLIVQFVNCPDIVPTNTEDKWYKELSILKSGYCNLGFTQSIDERWVKIRVSISCVIISSSGIEGYMTKNVTNVRTDKLLITYPKLTGIAISVCENNPSSFMHGEIKFRKSITLTFLRSKLESDLEAIKDNFIKLMSQIDSEILMVEQDTLARGKIIELVSVTITKEKTTYYLTKHSPFITELKEDTPVEFWGSLTYAPDNFITSTHIYPWMPTEISEEELPF
jgi:hypothetical protein